ncbi:hypothetical protein AX16_009917 [Volvariella volvacea WC 439]|nr:hypothetical protein AX16_009917 [Volvariella volvacea WC 439]
MSGLSAWIWGSSQIDDAIEKATSESLPTGAEDIALNLEICDQIRSKSAPPKDAMKALKRRLNHKNPNVQLLALSLTDICIKNGGDPFLVEIASREFMDNLVSILKMPTLNHDVKNTMLRLIQNWSIAFEGKPALSYVGQVYRTLTGEGFKFPPKDLTASSSAMVDTQTAPEWIDSDVCLRCRTAFTFTNRKHHCRNCGQVFDQQCSSKSLPLPHFGITQEVRVCDGCYTKLTRKADKIDQKPHRNSSNNQANRHRSANDLADAELQRAIQLSLQEMSGANSHARPGYTPSQPPEQRWQASEPPLVDRSTYPTTADEDDDPDLKAAIEASLREASAPKPSAPAVLDTPRAEYQTFNYDSGYSASQPAIVPPPPSTLPRLPNYDLTTQETDSILTFNQTIEQVEVQGGRDMSRYPAVNELYDKANSLRPKLALSLDDTARKEQMLADMNDKLSQAVKLYDQLLTEQLAYPRWRTQPSYQQANPTPSSPYSQTQQAPWAYQSQQPPSSQPTYASPSPTNSYQSYSQVAQAEQPHPAQQYSEGPPPVSQQSFTPVSIQHRLQSANVPPPPQVTSYQPAPSLAPSAPPASISPQLPVQSPPPLQADLNRQFTSMNLQRHHSVNVSSTPLAPVLHGVNLARSNTISTSPSTLPPAAHGPPRTANHYQHQHHQPPQRQNSQYQHSMASPPAPSNVTAPSALPQFPVAPTSAPQTFPMYGPSIPTGIAQVEERKEALLIDL